MKAKVVTEKQPKSSKANGVDVQRGPIKAHQPTMKHMTEVQQVKEDADNRQLRWSGRTATLKEPKR